MFKMWSLGLGLCLLMANIHFSSAFLGSNSQITRQSFYVAPGSKDSYRRHMVATDPTNAENTTPKRKIVGIQKGKANDVGNDDSFLAEFFTASEIDDSNVPPSLSIIMRSIANLASGSDIRGSFVDHSRVGSIVNVAHAIGKNANKALPPLTPLAAHCIGYAFAKMLLENYPAGEQVVIALGRDPRSHGSALADAFCRGAEGVENSVVKYTGIATTPSLFEFCRSNLCEGGVMVTASHLPADRNGFKFFTADGGFTKSQIQRLVTLASEHAQLWYDLGILPPTSGQGGVFCSEWVNFMPHYELNLKNAILDQVHADEKGVQQKHRAMKQTLLGLKIVLNAGNGSGGFFKKVLEDLGADVSGSIHCTPDANFPNGIPNPEVKRMIDETIKACEASNADIGIMFDTDADRCGFVAPRIVRQDGTCSDYEPLNRNRLIALLGVLFSTASPGCAIVTDSVTSNGLSTFLTEDLGLVHVRFIKGYANVINKAKYLTKQNIVNAEVAIETSGHCAMKETSYSDDGVYTAVKVIGMLAKARKQGAKASILSLIDNLKELDEVTELRMPVKEGSLEATQAMFDFAALELEDICSQKGRCENDPTSGWKIDRENLEGIRISTGDDGGFLMLRKSLHDPLLSLQVEASSKDEAKRVIVAPVLKLFEAHGELKSNVDLSALQQYTG